MKPTMHHTTDTRLTPFVNAALPEVRDERTGVIVKYDAAEDRVSISMPRTTFVEGLVVAGLVVGAGYVAAKIIDEVFGPKSRRN